MASYSCAPDIALPASSSMRQMIPPVSFTTGNAIAGSPSIRALAYEHAVQPTPHQQAAADATGPRAAVGTLAAWHRMAHCTGGQTSRLPVRLVEVLPVRDMDPVAT